MGAGIPRVGALTVPTVVRGKLTPGRGQGSEIVLQRQCPLESGDLSIILALLGDLRPITFSGASVVKLVHRVHDLGSPLYPRGSLDHKQGPRANMAAMWEVLGQPGPVPTCLSGLVTSILLSHSMLTQVVNLGFSQGSQTSNLQLCPA